MTMSIKHALAAVLGASLITACSEPPTGPHNTASFAEPRLLLAPDAGLVTFNSASCTLTDSSTGASSCSWNISNPAETQLNLSVQAVLRVSYDCVNPKNGRVASSEQRDLGTLKQYSGVSDPSLAGSNEAMPLPFLPTENTGSAKKQNACRGSTVPQSLTWQLEYWSVSVVTVSGSLRMSCFASDNRNGCFTS
jgi:hypothetical protein